MAVAQELLDILACPQCKGDIHLNKKKDGLICNTCRLIYEIRDDIPIMLIEEAKPLDIEEAKPLDIEDAKHLDIEDAKHLDIQETKALDSADSGDMPS